MADATKIEWTDSTFNPWIGCTPVGPGCDHCYAAALSKRTGGPAYESGAARRRTSDANWRIPVTWNQRWFLRCAECGWRGDKPARLGDIAVCPNTSCAAVDLRLTRRRVFCASLADVFDNEVDPAWRAELFALIAATPNLDWLLLTKRIGNVAKMIEAPGMQKCGLPENVWLGATVVNQAEADRDVPKLLRTGARRRFVSIEPMLGEVDLLRAVSCEHCHGWGYHTHGPDEIGCGACEGHEATPADLAESGLDWVIVGGESGAGARSMVLGWAKDVVRQCQAAGVPVLVKQIGARPTNREGERHAIKDRKGGDMDEWPPELRVRQFPGAEVCHG